MARFFTQLRFLLWKNYLLRKRQKALLATEIIWPIILFSILMLVRTRDLTEAHGTCHYDAKALPSTGFIPFLQSYLCTLSNKCNPYPTTDDTPGYVSTKNNQGIRLFVTPWLTLFNSSLDVNDISTLILDTIPLIDDINYMGKASSSPAPTITLNQLFNDPTKLKGDLVSCGMSNNSAQLFPQFKINRDLFVLTTIAILNNASWKDSIFCNTTHLHRSFSFGNDSDVTNVGQEICTKMNATCLVNILPNMSSINVGQLATTFDPLTLINYVSSLLTNLTGYGVDDYSLLAFAKSIPTVLDDSNAPGVHNLMSTLELMSNYLNTSNGSSLLTLLTCGQMTEGLGDAFRKSSDLQKMKDRFQDVDNEDEDDVLSDNSTVPGATTELGENKTSICYNFPFNPVHAKRCWNWLKVFRVPNKFMLPLYTLIRGYIFVTPQTPTVYKIVLELEDWLRSIDAVRRPILDFFHNADSYQNAFNQSDVAKAYKTLSNILTTLNGTWESDAPGLFNSPMVKAFRNLSALFVNSSDPSAMLPILRDRIEPLADLFECFEIDRFVFVESEEAMEVAGICLQDYYAYFSGLVFKTDADGQLTRLNEYKIRMANTLVDGTYAWIDRLWTPRPRDRPFIDTKYLYYGFSFLQDAVDRAIIKVTTNHTVETGIYAQQFPNPCYLLDVFQKALSGMFPFFMVLSWVFSFAIAVKNVVYEKELRLKEVMKVMGLGNGVHWVAWFLTSFSVLFCSICLLTAVLIFGNIVEYSDAGVILVLLVVYGIATITQAFLFSTLFSNANLCAASGGIIYFLLYLPYIFLRRKRGSVPDLVKLLSCFLPQVALGWCGAAISDWEEEGSGVQWSNMDDSPIAYHTLTFAQALRMMLADIAIHIVLTWYIENIRPGRYGMPRPYYFPFLPSYWCGYNVTKLEDTPTSRALNSGPAPENLEEDPLNLPLGVCVRHLSKEYANGTKAVSDLSINFYEGQITSFLGHNGAGKTTTLSMLTGLFPPTSGTAYIGGRDIRTDFDEVRHSLGMCPQYNVLFDRLTVGEQLGFYAGLKGVPPKNIGKEVDNLLKDVGLTKKKDSLASDLSGGMKRKLSVAVAFIGGSRTVILDEPTAGVDPFARRGIWDLLIKLKKGRTVILSTHHMDEADLLGDRIAIINQGRLRCCGSSLFMKRRFGSGYRMTVLLKGSSCFGSESNVALLDAPNLARVEDIVGGSSSTEPLDPSDTIGSSSSPTYQSSSAISEQRASLNPSELNVNTLGPPLIPLSKSSSVNTKSIETIEQFVGSHIKGAYLLERVASEIVFCLPSDDPKILMKFFATLDANLNELNIATYGVSDTTLEEIFLKMVGIESEEKMKKMHSGCSCCKFLRRKTLEKFAKPIRSVSPKPDENQLMESGEIQVIRAAPDEGDSTPLTSAGSSAHPVVEATPRSKFWIFKRRLGALLTKRFINFKRNLKGAFCEIFLPVVLVFVTIMSNELFSKSSPVNQPSIMLTPWLYGSEKNPNLVFFSLDNPSPSVNLFGSNILRRLEEPPGLGVGCVPDQPYQNSYFRHCKPVDSNWTIAGNAIYNVPNECYCDFRSDYHCPIDTYSPMPPQVVTNTTDILADLSQRNITQYILMTERMYRKKRYGGFSLGELDPLAAAYPDSDKLIHNFQSLADALQWFSGNNSLKFGAMRLVDIGYTFNDNDTLTPQQHFANIIRGLQTKDNIKIWFNNQGWAALPAYANTISNAQLRAALPAHQSPTEYGIVAFNHPMNFSKNQKSDGAGIMANSQTEIVISVMVILAFSVVPASFVLFVIDERNNHAKHLQHVSGVGSVLYWVSNFIWDITNFMVPVFLCMLLFVFFDMKPFIGSIRIACATFLLFVCYGFAVIPLMYPFTFFFQIPSLAFIVLLVGNFLLGVVSTISTVTLESLGQTDQELMEINDICMQVFLLLPQYCFGRGIFDLNIAYNLYEIELAVFGRSTKPNPFLWTILGRNYIALICQGVIGFIIVLCIEYRLYWIKFCGSWMPPRTVGRRLSMRFGSEDEDVRLERENVADADPVDYALLVKELVKDYTSLRAVDHLSFAVPAGQCFGLLGVNGAGKTTTFKILTGKLTPSQGHAFIDGYSVTSEQQKVNATLGYCPQFDALNGRLTGRETLAFYAKIRGIPANRIDEIVEWAISHMNLRVHADIVTDAYSGGNKRKLSTAIALIGNPKLILLDEPTTGMDPKARRFLWNRILDIIKDGRSVILTSHSMEECETLCGRMGIMVSGQMKCIGSVQHLKNKFGEGYTLTLKLGSDNPGLTRDAASFVVQQFPGAILKESHQGMLEYQLPVKGTSLSRVFGIVQSAKTRLGVDDYAVTQTTLDQVFIQFASEQVDVVDVPTPATFNTFQVTNCTDGSMPLDDRSLTLTVKPPSGASETYIRVTRTNSCGSELLEDVNGEDRL